MRPLVGPLLSPPIKYQRRRAVALSLLHLEADGWYDDGCCWQQQNIFQTHVASFGWAGAAAVSIIILF